MAGFALAAGGIGLAGTALTLFTAVGVFEFVRQFMRWSNAGYLSEHLPVNLRATGIGCAITVAGMSCTLFGFLANAVWNPNVPGYSREPFGLAAGLGLAGAAGLFVFDRFLPIRQAELPGGRASGPLKEGVTKE